MSNLSDMLYGSEKITFVVHSKYFQGVEQLSNIKQILDVWRAQLSKVRHVLKTQPKSENRHHLSREREIRYTSHRLGRYSRHRLYVLMLQHEIERT